jgi:uncharacterized repeat protein (TIGR02059 family)
MQTDRDKSRRGIILFLALALSFSPVPAVASAPTTSPTITSLKGGNGYIEIAFSNLPSGSTNLKVALSEDGTNYATPIALSPADTISPVTYYLDNGKTYFVKILGTNGSGDGPLSSAFASTVSVGPKTQIKTSGSTLNAYLMGTYAEVGLRANGAFGTDIALPSDFHGNQGNCLGFRVDRDKDGWGNRTDDGDFFCPGSPYEGWFIKVGDSGSDFHNSNASTGVAGALSDVSAADGLQSVKWTSTGLITNSSGNASGSGIKLVQVASVPDSGQVLHVDITLTNSSSSAVENVYYARAFDPDNNTAPDVFTTTNTVLSRSNPAEVRSTWSNGAFILLKSNETNARAARLISGLSGSSPKHIWDAPTTTSANSWTSNTAPQVADAGTGVAVKFDSIGAGESKTFRISYVLSDNEANLPTAPVLDSVSPGNGQLALNFTQSEKNPTNYQYSVDGGISWTTRDPRSTSSPLLITGLTNGTTYQLRLRGVNSSGTGPSSNQLSGAPVGNLQPPTIDSLQAGSTSVTINFSPGATGGKTLENYQYAISTNGGSTFGSYVSFSPVTTASPLIVRGLSSSTSYVLKIRAVSSDSSSSDSNTVSATTARPPGPPTIASIDSLNQSLQVNFTGGQSGGSPIITYEYSLDAGSTWNSRSPASVTSPLLITGLTNGTTYQVMVRAINELGSGDSSNQISGVPSGKPLAPEISGNATPTSQTINLTITPGGSGGSPITTYEYSTDRGATWRTRDDGGGTSTGLAITKLSSDGTTALSNGIEYRVQVRAVNANGVSAASNDISAVPATVPDAPSISGIISSNGILRLPYRELSNGGRPVTEVEYSLDGTTWLSAGSSSGEVRISGLTNGTSYAVKLRLKNDVGNSEPSLTFSGRPSSTPLAPTITAIIPSSQKITIEFTAGSNNGSNITNYEYSLDGGLTWISFSPAVITSPLVITGLTNNTTYQVQLRAVNENGSGEATGTSLATMPRLIAEAPTITSIAGGNTTLTVNFTAGADNGLALSNYEFSTDNGNSWLTRAPSNTTSPLTISGLTNGTTYQVRIRAVNANGSGAQSAMTTGVPFTVPAKPTITSTSNGSSGLSVNFSAGSSNGRDITNYEYSTNGGSSWTAFSPTQITSPLVIAGLASGTYYLKIRAVNLAGAGIASDTQTVTVADTSPPTLSSASVPSAGTTIVLTFGEALSGTPATARFTVTVAGVTATISSIAVSSATVTLTLARPIAQGQSVSVQYTDFSISDDSSGILQDAAGNDVVEFTNAVTNSSSLTAPVISSETIQGEALVGSVLTASATVTGNSTPTFTYAWQRSASQGGPFSSIAGATSQSYTITESDRDSFIRVLFRASNSIAVTSATSSPTAEIKRIAESATVSGMALVGNSLAVTSSNVAQNSTISYQWQKSSSESGPFIDIPSATSSEIILPAAVGGLFIRAALVAQRSSVSATVYSSPILVSSPQSVVSNETKPVSYMGPEIRNFSKRLVDSSLEQEITVFGIRLDKFEKLYVNGILYDFSSTTNQFRFKIPRLSPSGEYEILLVGDHGTYSFGNALRVLLPQSARIRLNTRDSDFASRLAAFSDRYSYLMKSTCLGYIGPTEISQKTRSRAVALANQTCVLLGETRAKRLMAFRARTQSFDLNQVLISLAR